MITAALAGELDDVDFETHAILQLEIPKSCPGVPDDILNPVTTWKDKQAYLTKAQYLAAAFNKNFTRYEAMATPEMLEGAPMAETTH